MSDLTQAKSMIKSNSIKNCSNWLYHHTQLLGSLNVINGTQVLNELKSVAKKQIDNQYYAGAMATLRKLNDVNQHPNGFYDANDYEFVPLSLLQEKIMKE